MPAMLPSLFATLVAVNALTVFCFWHDKQRARRGEWRIGETNLLGLALIGGS